MAFLKKHWFPLVNGLVFLAMAIFYLVVVRSYDADEAKLQSEIEGQIRSYRALAQKRPTEAFKEILRQSRESLDQQAGQVRKALQASDQLVECYFSLAGDGVVPEAPDQQRLPEYKQKLLERWNRMAERYTPDPAAVVQTTTPATLPFACERSLVRQLEPKWLRDSSLPALNEVKDAQKRYWLAENLLRILETSGIDRLGQLKIEDSHLEAGAEYAGRPAWTARDIVAEVRLPHTKVRPLLKRIHESRLLLRTTGLEQKGDVDSPLHVRSNAPFIAFREDAAVTLKLWLRHYDLLAEEEGKAMKDGAQAGGRRQL